MLKTRRFATVLLALLGYAVADAQTQPADAEFKRRSDAVDGLVRADPVDWPKAESQAEALLKDYPTRFESYLCLMVLSWQAEMAGKRDIERRVASRIAILDGPTESETPDWAGNPVAWAKGVVHRLDLEGQTLELKFSAVDGRRVDLATMRGKVVLVDFWATWCPPCLAALPGLQSNYQKYHSHGLEVVGISWDQDQGKLVRFVTQHSMPWPQYFEGPHRMLGEQLGIGGIPFTLLIDRKGRLRAATAFPDKLGFTELLQELIAE